jgi:hypothetical protein
MWRAVYDHALLLEPGDIIDWAALEKLLDYDPSAPGASRSPILTASRRLLTDHSRCLVSVRGVGYKVAKAEEQEGIGRSYQRGARRKLRKAVDVTTFVDRNALDETQRKSLDALAHVLAAQNAMLKRHDTRITTVETATQKQDARLDVLEATLRKHGIDVPQQQTINGEVLTEDA